MNRRSILVLLPVIFFAGLAVLFYKGLSGDPSTLPSALINKPVPAFSLAAIDQLGVPGLSDAELKSGQVHVVNIWASWCVPCREEHPVLMELAKRSDIRLVGINNKDEPDNARRFLGALGLPFAAVGADRDGRVTIDWGGYGVPETFIVDGKGIIRNKHVGPLTLDDIKPGGSFAVKLEAAQKPLP
ncbi:DsbE family thiol:disulfide interchange protein [Aestuariivirga sp.]|uniref:DsbE family thiol:disulfide interchange protein n=1 Tax=Aestuariivirga sp. TaxID=2650926 RepID=UPI0039E7222A